MNSQQPRNRQPVNPQPLESQPIDAQPLESQSVHPHPVSPQPGTPVVPAQTVYGRPVTPAETAYRDGYVQGRSSEQQVRLTERELHHQRERDTESNAIASGLLFGLIIAALAGLGALAYFYTTQDQRSGSQNNTPVQVSPQPQRTTIIERTIDRTRESAPVQVPAPVVVPPPVNIQVPNPAPQNPAPAPQQPTGSSSESGTTSGSSDEANSSETAPSTTQP